MKSAQLNVLPRVEKHRSGGYTIVESLIFLAVSSAIAVSVMMLISGQQRKTEFQQSVREFESNIQDVANDVATGFASSNSGNCWINAAGILKFTSPPAAPANYESCIFVGRSVEFNDSSSDFKVYTLVGRQHDKITGNDVQSITEADPQILTSATATKLIQSGVKVGKITCADCAPADIGSFGFITTFLAANATSGNVRTDLVPVKSSKLNLAVTPDKTNLIVRNPPNGIQICLLSGGTDQYAIVSVGGRSGNLVTNTVINEGTSCP